MKLFGKYKNVKEMLEKESDKDLLKKFPHGKPVSRRDLLKAGALQFAATITAPSLFEILLNAEVAKAQSCLQTPTFVGLKLNGGAAMLGNFVAMAANRDYLNSYEQLGLGTKAQISARSAVVFGEAKFFDGSQMLAGIRTTATATTLANTSFVGIPVASNDDTDQNPFDITYFMSKFGVVGNILPNLGRRQTATGIAQQPALAKTPPTPLVVGSLTDISNALSVQGSLVNLSDNQKVNLFSAINKLSESQARNLASNTGGNVFQQLVNQATSQNISLVSSSTNGIDPLQDTGVGARFNTAWANANNQNMQNQNAGAMERVFGTMVYNTLKGNAGTCNMDMGGYDYHGQGRQTQDAQDLQAGRVMGQILESAAIMQRPVMLMVTSDGAVGAPAGSAPGAAFTSDRGNGGCIYLFAYHPLRRPTSVDKAGKVDHQVGQVAGQAAVDSNFLTGNNPALAGLAAFANFASFSGNLGAFFTIAGNVWNQDQVDQVVRLRKV